MLLRMGNVLDRGSMIDVLYMWIQVNKWSGGAMWHISKLRGNRQAFGVIYCKPPAIVPPLALIGFLHRHRLHGGVGLAVVDFKNFMHVYYAS